MPDTPLNPDALEAASRTVHPGYWKLIDKYPEDSITQKSKSNLIEEARSTVSAYLTVAQPEVNSAVEAFINQRPEYITALKNTRGTDDQSDYWRWQGHAESRRQLAQTLGWTVPHNPGEATRPEVKP